jgi:carbonic anhydrase
MMKKGTLLKILTISLLSMTATAAHAADWSYTGATGPNFWSTLTPTYFTCGDKKIQSPINIEAPFKQQSIPIKINYQPAYFRIYQNSHNIYLVNAQFAKDIITFNNRPYELIQIHFHVPAEHEINGKKYAMEAHLVNQDDEGDTVAIAVLFTEGEKNTFLSNFYQMVKSKSNQGMLQLSPSELIPQGGFYSYSGSLTTPSCAPVTWVVMKNTKTVSQHQLDVFKDKVIPMNARPIQARENRDIISS